MAPFSRNSRGKSARGRGKVAFSRNSGPKNTFYSTRVEAPIENTSEGSIESESESNEEDLLQDSSEQSSSGDEDEHAQTASSYNALLQSLNAQAPKSEPRRKRQKASHEPSPAQSAQLDGTISQDGGKEAEDLDYVDEREEGGTALYNDDAQEEDEGVDDPGDRYEHHFSGLPEENLVQLVKEITASSTSQKLYLQDKWKAIISRPLTASSEEMSKISFAAPRSLADLSIKEKLRPRAQKLLKDLEGFQGSLAQVMFSYSDLLFCGRQTDNIKDLRTLTCLHVLNHILKTRDKVIKNSFRITKTGSQEDVEYRDQGFTRPKVLMLLPTRQACVKAVETIISLYAPEQQENKKRFLDSYSKAEEMPSPDMPQDFHELFDGNDDDMFRLGLKFTRKTLKLFAQFYNSDIIFASPLGLRMALGGQDSKKEDHDFLSSIEVVVMDHADALLMQNWEHVEHILEHLNLQPKEAHGCDFSRVRNWYLDGNARYLRQTIVLSSFNTPELNQVYTRCMLNIAGKAKITPQGYDGEIVQLGASIKQTFLRFDAAQPSADPDTRFKYFTNVIMPKVSRTIVPSSGRAQGVLIFIPSYMDFVRVRNFLASSIVTQNISFGSISEYTPVPDVARARSHFFSGRHSALLYTSRAHHFRRYRIRGVKRVIMYALPDNPRFYQEIVGGLLSRSISEGQTDLGEANVKVLFSKWDSLKLERIVGTSRIGTMLREKGGDTFDFV